MKYFVYAVICVVLLLFWRAWLRRARYRHIDRYAFPPGLLKKFRETRPGLTPAQESMVFDALREYFHICRVAGREFVSMPSHAVDDAWHTFILFTRSYETFCQRAFGHYLHHTPAEAMSTPTLAQDGIRRAWRLACKREHINPKSPDRLPLLFGVDALLGIANGFKYSLTCEPGPAGSASYCASHIGCGGGCSGGSGCGSGSSGCGGGGCGGGGD